MNKKNLTARQAMEHLETYVSSGSSESGISHYSSDFSLADSVSSGSRTQNILRNVKHVMRVVSYETLVKKFLWN